MPRVIPPEGGAPRDVSQRRAPALLAQGWTLADGDTTVVETPYGTETIESGEDLSATLGAFGTVAPERYGLEEARREQAEYDYRLQRDHGSAIDEIISGVEGAASVATLGLYDVAAYGWDMDTAKRAEASPLAHGIGAGIGTVASLGLGAPGLAGRALAWTPMGLAARAGSAVAGTGGGIARTAAGTALESAIVGSTMAANQAIVSDVPLTSETLIEKAITGGVYAGLLGGAAGGAFAGASKLMNRAERALGGFGRTAPQFDDLADQMAYAYNRIDDHVRTVGQAERTYQATSARVGKDLDEYAEQVGAWKAAAQSDLDNLATQARESVNPRVIEEWRATRMMNGGPEALQAKAARAFQDFEVATTAGRTNQAYKALGKYRQHLGELHDAAGLPHTYPDMPARADFGTGRRVAGQHVDELAANLKVQHAQVDDLLARARTEPAALSELVELTGVAPKARLADNLRTLAAGPARVDPAVARNLEKLSGDLKGFLLMEPGTKFTSARMKRVLSADPDQFLAGMTKLRDHYVGALESATKIGRPDLVEPIAEALQRAAQVAGARTGSTAISKADIALLLGVGELPDLPGPFEELVKAYAVLRLARGGGPQAVRSGFLGRLKRSAFAGAAGNLGGRIPGGPLVKAVARSSARQAAFSGMGRAPSAAAMESGATTARQSIDNALAAFKAGPKATTRMPLVGPVAALKAMQFYPGREEPETSDLRKLYKQRRDELTRLVANLDRAGNTVHDSLAELRQEHLMVGDQVEAKLLERPAAVLERMPKDPGTMRRFGASGWQPSESQIIAWAEYTKGVYMPVATAVDALNGHITPQSAAGLREHNPGVFTYLQMKLMSDPEVLGNMDLGSRTRVSVLLGMRHLEPSADYSFVSFNSGMLAPTPPEAAPPAPSAPLTKPEPETKAQTLRGE